MAFTPSKVKKNPHKIAELPNLTSMTDMMTLILLFLLKLVAISGMVIHPVPGIELPLSSTLLDPQKRISFVINQEGIFQDLDGRFGENLASAEEMKNDEITIYPRIITYLDSIRKFDSEVGRSERRIVTVQGDRTIEYRHIYKFISTCGEAGFSTIQFIVEKKGD